MNYQQILENIYQEIQPFAGIGKQADYIPALAKVDPDQFGICINTIQGETFMLALVSPSRVFRKSFHLPYASALRETNYGKEWEKSHRALHSIPLYS